MPSARRLSVHEREQPAILRILMQTGTDCITARIYPCRCTHLTEIQLDIDLDAASVIGSRLQPIIGGKLADSSYDGTATHPRTLLSGCEPFASKTALSRLHTMVEEWKAFVPGLEGASQEKCEADTRQIEALQMEVEEAQEQIDGMRQVLADATAHASGIERELEGMRLKDFNAVKCSLEYCRCLKITPHEGSGRMGTCHLHRNLIDSIAKTHSVKAKVVWEYMTHNEIGADVLRRACDRSDRDDEAKRMRKEYMNRVRVDWCGGGE